MALIDGAAREAAEEYDSRNYNEGVLRGRPLINWGGGRGPN